MSARSPFQKFSLKPSSLSQHTVNFNKILEEVAAPKIESIVLEKPIFGHAVVQPVEPTKNEETELEQVKEIPVEPSVAAVKVIAAPAFIFGESLTDRVVNAETTESADKENGKDKSTEKIDRTESLTESVEVKPIFSEVDHEKHNNHENDINTVIRMNCKLFVLDKDQKDQAVWSERGYGVLKIIDCNDGLNLKIMMWTDKCYRLVLNTKFFENMVIERVNRKSIRLNAQDEGTIKNFLIKCGHPNEGEELAAMMINRLNTYKENLALSIETSKVLEDSEINEKHAIFECECNWESFATKNTIALKDLIKTGKISLHKQSICNGQQHILVDIYDDAKSKVLSNQFLKSIKVVSKSKESWETFEATEFEIKESFNLTYKVAIKNSQLASKFLKYYMNEVRCNSNTSNNTSINDSLTLETSSDEEEGENESESIRNSNTSRSLESSLTETNKSETELDIDNKKLGEEGVGHGKKRKPDDSYDDSDSEAFKNENIKKMSLDESSCSKLGNEEAEQQKETVCLKRNACNSSQDSSQECKAVKKTRVTEDDL